MPLHDLGVTTVTNADTGGTDHLPFDAVGVPGFQFVQDALDYETRTHHSNMDVWEALLPDDLRQAAVVEAILCTNGDAILPRKAPSASYGQAKPLLFPGLCRSEGGSMRTYFVYVRMLPAGADQIPKSIKFPGVLPMKKAGRPHEIVKSFACRVACVPYLCAYGSEREQRCIAAASYGPG